MSGVDYRHVLSVVPQTGERREELKQPGDAAGSHWLQKLQNKNGVFQFHQTSFSLAVQEKKFLSQHIYGIMVGNPKSK